MNAQNVKDVEKVNIGAVFGKVLYVIDRGYDDDEVVINKGDNDGISPNDRFLIYAIGEELFDPDTGENLGKLEIVKGIAKPKHIQEKTTTLVSAEYYPPRKRIIKRNDILNFSREDEIIEESPPQVVPLKDVKVGDLVKPMKKKISS
jgi:hypothetical protein